VALALYPVGVRRLPSAPTWLSGAAAVGMCAVATLMLVPPALADSPTSRGTDPVRVRLEGQVSTAGLPGTPAVSSLAVRNDGAAPLTWAVRTTVTGTAAVGVRIEVWDRTGAGCDAPSRPLRETQWSTASLAPGASVAICVRISTSGTAPGTAVPKLIVDARAV